MRRAACVPRRAAVAAERCATPPALRRWRGGGECSFLGRNRGGQWWRRGPGPLAVRELLRASPSPRGRGRCKLRRWACTSLAGARPRGAVPGAVAPGGVWTAEPAVLASPCTGVGAVRGGNAKDEMREGAGRGVALMGVMPFALVV